MRTDYLRPWIKGEPITAERLNQLVARAAPVQSVGGSKGIRVTETSSGTSLSISSRPRGYGGGAALARFPALITGNKDTGTGVFGNQRWHYSWAEAELSTTDVSILEGGRSGTTDEDYAMNMYEMTNTSRYKMGVDVDADDYPDGYDLRPIGGAGDSSTHKVDFCVEMIVMKSDMGFSLYRFYAPNSHDGSCS